MPKLQQVPRCPSPRNEAVLEELPVIEVADGNVVRLQPIEGFGVPSVAGYGALMSVAYSACEQTKARSLSSLPVTVVRAKGDKVERVPDHPLAVLLGSMPNEAMTSADFLSWHRLRCDTFGTAYWRLEWHRDRLVAIWPVLGGVYADFSLDRPEGRRLMYELSGDAYNKAGRYFSDEIVAIKTNLTKDGLTGMSLARMAAENIGLSVDLERFYRAMLKNGNHHLGHVEVPEQVMNDKVKKDIKAAIERKSGIDASGKTPIFMAGAKWVANAQTMKDASVIEQERWTMQQVCRACNVPPWKVYDQESTTYAGSQQANIDYVTDTMLSDTRAIELALSVAFRAVGQDDHKLKFNLKGLMRGDDQARSAYYRELAYMGALTREVVCELEDIDAPEGVKAPLFPLNYGTVNPDGTVNVFASNVKRPADGTQTGKTD